LCGIEDIVDEEGKQHENHQYDHNDGDDDSLLALHVFLVVGKKFHWLRGPVLIHDNLERAFLSKRLFTRIKPSHLPPFVIKHHFGVGGFERVLLRLPRRLIADLAVVFIHGYRSLLK